jgi:serine/threonine protein kinase
LETAGGGEAILETGRRYTRFIVIKPGESLGAYTLIDRIGAGGMGEVWKAEDPRLGRTVAIKILPPAVAQDAEAMLRLQREARTAAQLYHPNIATIHSIEEHDGRLFIVMEYVQGEPLTNLIRRRALSEADICRVGSGVADALAEAHEKGIVHRDIKPDNIVVNGQRVKVLDFGIAKRIGLENTASSDAPTAFVTQQGMIVGTVHYMSPEQALGKPLDARTDIFSLGVVLYEAITGRLPFSGETITETITQIVRDEPEAPIRVNPSVTPGLNALVQRCLRKNRDDRFATASELSAALDHQLARASTQLYTAPTAVRPVRAPRTVLTGSQLKTVQEKSRRSLAGPIAAVGIVLIAAIAAVWGMQRRNVQAPVPVPVTATFAAPVPAPQPSQATVSVSAAPPPVVEEQRPSPAIRAPSPAAAGEGHIARSPAAAVEGAPRPGEGAPPPPPAQPPQTSDVAYNAGIAALAAGKPHEARLHFIEAVQADHDNSKAHFRLGEIAMLNRNYQHAADELQRALDHPERLDNRETMLAQLCLALSNGARFRAGELGREINRLYPGDPDFEAIKRTFETEQQRQGFPKRHRLRP